jgi:hypothetical protein
MNYRLHVKELGDALPDRPVVFMKPSTSLVPEGTASHSQEFVDAGKSESAHNCVIYGAKAIGGACYDLLTKEGLLDQVKTEFAENKKKNQ